MSGGTSAGNIITEAAATYAVRTWVDITKVDELGVIADAQLDAIIAANWFNNVDDNLIQVNAWMNGTGVAPHVRATIGTIATVNATAIVSTDIETTNLDVTNLTVSAVDVAALVVGAGSLSDGVSTADDLVVGDLSATDRGVTVLSTSVARLCFADTAATLTGFVSYTHATDTLALGVAGAAELNLTSSTLAPSANGGLSLGTSSLKYLESHATTVTAYSALNVGDATGSPVATINRDSAGTGDLIFASEGVTGWRLRHAAAGGLTLDRYSGGVFADSVTFATSMVTFPAEVTVTDGLTVAGALTYLSNSSALMRIGSGSNTAAINLRGATTTIGFNNGANDLFTVECDGNLNINRYSGGVYQDGIIYDGSTGEFKVSALLTVGSASAASPILKLSKDTNGDAYLAFYNEDTIRWAWQFDSSEDLVLRRYDGGGSFTDALTVSASTGSWTFPAGIALSGVLTNRFTAGSGAPSGGSNGDLYWNVTGSKTTCLYFKVSGVWQALAT